MNTLNTVMNINELNAQQTEQMFCLMDKYYDNMVWENFTRDLSDKDYVVMVFDQNQIVKAFSTAKIISLNIDDIIVYGMFSGDTISDIDDTESNCSTELIKYLFNFFYMLSEDYLDDFFYLFLISKGYRTYRILQYFKDFYPCYNKLTPEFEQKIIDTFGTQYSTNYKPETGIIYSYKDKDRLKKGVLEIDGHHMKNPHIKYFSERNPNWNVGDELVCTARIISDNLRKVAYKLIKPEIMERFHNLKKVRL